MIKRMIISAVAATSFLATMTASAVAPGFYMGLMLGPASNTSGDQQAQKVGGGTTLVTARSGQFATRLFLGNKLNQYAGYELGIDYLTKIKYDSKGVNTCNGPNASMRAFDVLVKGTLPLGSSFDVFGRAGAGYMYTTTSGSLNPDQSKSCGASKHEGMVRPIVGIGASYDLTQNWVADLSWTRFMVGGTIQNMDAYSVGITYHFVDTYCGQFLC